jgi:potassium-transporting ATPase KdpC subunit
VTSSKNRKLALQPALVIALVSLVTCGLVFPLFVTGIAQVLFPYQSNGEIIQVNGALVGSNLIAQNFTLPIFFHPRNDSASSVDPDITIGDAYSQISLIHNSTGLSEDSLTQLVNANKEGIGIFGVEYVNVLRVNLDLIRTYPTVYRDFQ